MKRILSASVMALTILCAFFPVCGYLAFRYGYDLTIRGSFLSIAVLTAAFVTVTALLLIYKTPLSRPYSVPFCCRWSARRTGCAICCRAAGEAS